MSKKLEEKQQRRLAEERKRQEAQRAARKRNLLTFGVAIVVGALVVFLIMKDRPNSGSVDAGVAAKDAGCGPVEDFDAADEAKHVEDGTDVQYESTPPTSGDHYGQPADARFYSESIPEETVVHNLEHGQIVIWYNPDGPNDMIDAIESVVDEEPVGLVAVPYTELSSGDNVAFSAWGHAQTCAEFSNDVLDEFRVEFQGKGPENVGVPTYEIPS